MVPGTMPVCSDIASAAPRRASPKSASCARSPSTRMLAGLTSPWTRPATWAVSSASAIAASRRSAVAWSGGSVPGAAGASRRRRSASPGRRGRRPRPPRRPGRSPDARGSLRAAPPPAASGRPIRGVSPPARDRASRRGPGTPPPCHRRRARAGSRTRRSDRRRGDVPWRNDTIATSAMAGRGPTALVAAWSERASGCAIRSAAGPHDPRPMAVVSSRDPASGGAPGGVGADGRVLPRGGLRADEQLRRDRRTCCARAASGWCSSSRSRSPAASRRSGFEEGLMRLGRPPEDRRRRRASSGRTSSATPRRSSASRRSSSSETFLAPTWRRSSTARATSTTALREIFDELQPDVDRGGQRRARSRRS